MHCLWLCLWWSYKKTKKKSLKYYIMALDPKWTWWSSYNGFCIFFMPQYLGLKHRPIWLYTWWDSFTIYIKGIIPKALPNSITMYNVVPLILLISVGKNYGVTWKIMHLKHSIWSATKMLFNLIEVPSASCNQIVIYKTLSLSLVQNHVMMWLHCICTFYFHHK